MTQGVSRQVYMASSPHIAGARTWVEGGNVSHAGRSITAFLPGPVVNRIELIQLCQELGRILTNDNSQSHMSRADTSCFAGHLDEVAGQPCAHRFSGSSATDLGQRWPYGMTRGVKALMGNNQCQSVRRSIPPFGMNLHSQLFGLSILSRKKKRPIS